jgi:transposase
LKMKYETLKPILDERSYRLCLAADARSMGHGGVSKVASASGASRNTIYVGIKELESEGSLKKWTEGRIRRPGAGRKARTEQDSYLLEDLDRLLDPATRGDPMSPLRWSCKSTPKLTEEMRALGHIVSQPTVWRLLESLGYSMQSNRKTKDGTDNPDRNDQFEFLNSSVIEFMKRGDPVISVDTKKKELIGDFKNSGREWQKKGEPVEVRMHDFADPELGKGIPYGVYDLGRNEGWVSVGITHDTAEFAVETIRRWWKRMGRVSYPQAKRLLITADGGGSNGSRVRLWKWELCRWAEEVGLRVDVRHFPPGTSKWNKIEHRMFCHITENWRGRPLTSLMTIVNMIGATRTAKGLKIEADVDDYPYETGQKISDDEMANLPIIKCEFHGDWNYQVTPISSSSQKLCT